MRGKRSRHSETRGSHDNLEELDDAMMSRYTRSSSGQCRSTHHAECQFTPKFGEECYFSSAKYPAKYQDQSSSASCRSKTWPKEDHSKLGEDVCGALIENPRTSHLQNGRDPRVSTREEKRAPRSSSTSVKKTSREDQQRLPKVRNPGDHSGYKREYLVSTGDSRHYIPNVADPIPAIDEVGRFLEQAEARSRSVKQLAREVENQKYFRSIEQRQEKQRQRQKEIKQQQQQQQHLQMEAQPPPTTQGPKAQAETQDLQNTATTAHSTSQEPTLQTFKPPQVPSHQNGTSSNVNNEVQNAPLQYPQSQQVTEPTCAQITELTDAKRTLSKNEPPKSQSNQVLKVSVSNFSF